LEITQETIHEIERKVLMSLKFNSSGFNPNVERFRVVFKKSKPEVQMDLVKKFLGREMGRDILAEALTKAMKDSAFVGTLLGNEQNTLLLAKALKHSMKDIEFTKLVFRESNFILGNNKVVDEAYKDYKKRGGAPLYGEIR